MRRWTIAEPTAATTEAERNPRPAAACASPAAREKIEYAALAALIAYATFRNVVAALSKPFWFDELLTWIVARQPDVPSIWRALRNGADAQGPFFYLIERISATLVKNEHLAFRLPSIIAFSCLLSFLFVIVKKHGGGTAALICAAIPLLTVLSSRYATEARSYSMVVACVAFALVCYQRAPAAAWLILMASSLALAESLHYYAFFAFVPFAATELFLSVKTARFRLGVWLALLCGLVPLVMGLPLLWRYKAYYGAHVFAPPAFGTVLAFYAWSFDFLIRARTMDEFLLILALAGTIALTFRKVRIARFADPSFPEQILIITLLGVPFLIYAFTKVAHGALDPRYMLPTVLAFPLGAGYILPRLNRIAVLGLACALLFGIASLEVPFWRAERGHFGSVVSPAAAVVNFVNSARHADLPIVVSEAFVYLQIVYYETPEARGRFVSLVDPDKAVVFAGSDNVDKNLIALSTIYPLGVKPFADFARNHRRFLLYSGGGSWDWWPSRFMQEGDFIQLIGSDQGQRLYLVNLDKSSR